jgi:YidC/Oxa1 family membrane protein insertase
VEQTEEVYGLPKKKVVDVGYPLLDDMLKNYEAYRSTHQKSADEQKMVLIAPSWQKDNIVDSCLDDLLDSLKGHGYKVVVRPHPQHVRHMPEKMEALKERFKDDPNVVIQTDFSDTNTVLEADMLITDWSDIATEYVFTTLRPVLYINTPMKIMNPEYTKIKAEPLNLIMRRETGKDLDPANIKEAHSVVQYLLDHSDEYQQKNYELREANVYNIGTAGKTGAEYLIQDVFAHVKEAEEHEKK